MSKQHSSVRAYGILLHEDAVALVRSSNPQHQPPLWWLPGGGIDFGETPEETLVREFKEETGLSVDLPELFSVTSDVRKRDNGDRIHTVRIIYTVRWLSGELTHEVHGTTDHAAWYPSGQLDELNLADYAREAIHRLLRK
ncbi:MAG: NUDIX domain-containing protein [Actinomycetota bacterium]|jgi:ADP-ribose pyrophosphatase YjhB (NUDIX family)|nr:NUDIX domain-containing protein [Actinomycetota bacterium]